MATPAGSPRAHDSDHVQMLDYFPQAADAAHDAHDAHDARDAHELGFRSPAPALGTPIPDKHGLGWPGACGTRSPCAEIHSIYVT